MAFEKRVTFTGAYDKRDPDPAKNYGVHGVDVYFDLIGPLGAVRFVLFTGWNPYIGSAIAPVPAQVEIHSRACHNGGRKSEEDCPLTGGACWYKCYYNLADEVYQALAYGGDAGLWDKMESLYHEELGG